MKREDKHIDEVFREGLIDLNVTPPADVWETVEQRISRRKFNFIPVYRLAAASVLLTMIIGSFWLIFLRKPVDRNLADQPVLSNDTQTISKPVTPVQAGKKTVTAVTSREREIKQVASEPRPAEVRNSETQTVNAPAHETQPVIAAMVVLPENKTQVVQEYTGKNQDVFTVLAARSQVLEAPIDLSVKRKAVPAWSMLPQTGDIAEATSSKAQWSIGGNFGPFYTYRTLTSKDNYYISYLNTQENGVVAYAGGFTVNYSKGKSRFSVQTGVNYARMGQMADEVIAFKSIKTGELALLETKGNEFIHVSEGRLAYDENPVFIANQTSPAGMDQSDFLLTRVGSGLYETVGVRLKQDFEFVEIPIILRYNLLDAGFGVNLLGGIGSSFLVSGKSLVLSGSDVIPLGNTADLRTANLNGIVGVGMSYKISKSFSFRLEPTLKYYLNPLNKYSSVHAHPYSIGVYSGLCLSF
ncbi:MAG: PorT family protein [Chlorobi bacterium]|nr:PorT family protein [Chlorobiota bacterium]